MVINKRKTVNMLDKKEACCTPLCKYSSEVTYTVY